MLWLARRKFFLPSFIYGRNINFPSRLSYRHREGVFFAFAEKCFYLLLSPAFTICDQIKCFIRGKQFAISCSDTANSTWKTLIGHQKNNDPVEMICWTTPLTVNLMPHQELSFFNLCEIFVSNFEDMWVFGSGGSWCVRRVWCAMCGDEWCV